MVIPYACECTTKGIAWQVQLISTGNRIGFQQSTSGPGLRRLVTCIPYAPARYFYDPLHQLSSSGYPRRAALCPFALNPYRAVLPCSEAHGIILAQKFRDW